MAVSLRASERGRQIVEQARRRKGWAKTEVAWYEAAATSLATLKRFLHGSPVSRASFIKICESLELDWQAISDTTELIPTSIGELFELFIPHGSTEESTRELIFQASERYVEN